MYSGTSMLWGSRRRGRTSATRIIHTSSCIRVKLEWCMLWHASIAWWGIQQIVHTQTVVQARVFTIVVPSISTCWVPWCWETSRLAFMEYKATLWLAIIGSRLWILHQHLLPALGTDVTFAYNQLGSCVCVWGGGCMRVHTHTQSFVYSLSAACLYSKMLTGRWLLLDNTITRICII